VTIRLERTPLVQTFIYYRPVFRSQNYRHAEYKRLIEITTTTGVLISLQQLSGQ